MISRTTERFRALYQALPPDAQRQARVAYRFFHDNPYHGSLQFKRVSATDPALHSARIGAHYRALGLLDGETETWIWIGSHEAYNAAIRGR